MLSTAQVLQFCAGRIQVLGGSTHWDIWFRILERPKHHSRREVRGGCVRLVLSGFVVDRIELVVECASART
jgi:hypothetical protein